MQWETALRLPALAMHLSKVVKTLVLRATNVPKRTANTMPTISAKAATSRPVPGRVGGVSCFANSGER